MTDRITGRGWLARDEDDNSAWRGVITIAGYQHFLHGHVEYRDGRMVLALRAVEPAKVTDA